MNPSTGTAKPVPGPAEVSQTYPFLFFDRVLTQTPNSLELLKNISTDEWSSPLQGPMPGWAVLEVMAQAAGRLGQALEAGTPYRFCVLSRIKRARFRRAVHPGDQLRISTRLIKSFERSLALRVAVRTEAGRIANADFYFFRF